MQEINISYYAIPGVPKALPHNANLILNLVCDYFKVTKESLNGRKRKREFVTARHVAMYLLKTQTDLSLKRIGRQMYRDHTTVIHAMAKINGFIYIGDEPTITAIQTITSNIHSRN